MDSQNKSQRLFDPPSSSYKEARESGVYRLSELMFGSLLAAYILGFVGAVATVGSSDGALPPLGDALRPWLYESGDLTPSFLYAIDFILISVAFSYVTASLYINYHAGILTMPHLPIERLRWDFVLALSQAIFFGLSILYPLAFVFSVGSILLYSLARQSYECGKLAAEVARVMVRRASSGHPSVSESLPVVKREQAGRSEDDVERIKQRIRGAFKEKGSDSDEEKKRKKEMLPLQLWAGPRPRSWFGASLLFLVGLLAIVFPMVPTTQTKLTMMLNIYIPIHLGVILVVIWAAHRTLKQRGPLLVHSRASEGADPIMLRMDKAAELLSKRIEGREQ